MEEIQKKLTESEKFMKLRSFWEGLIESEEVMKLIRDADDVDSVLLSQILGQNLKQVTAKVAEDVGKMHRAIRQQAKLIDLAHKSEMRLLVDLEGARASEKRRPTRIPILRPGVPAVSPRRIGRTARAQSLVRRALTVAGLNAFSRNSATNDERGFVPEGDFSKGQE